MPVVSEAWTFAETVTMLKAPALNGGLPAGTVERAHLVQDNLQEYALPLTEFCVTGTGARLGASAGTPAGAFGLTVGTHGSATPIIVGEDAYYNSKTNRMRIQRAIPPEYVAGETLQIVIRAKVGATMGTEQSIDVSCYLSDEEGGLGSDLIATAAQNLTTSYVDYTFTVTAGGLAAGDVLDIEITGVANDTGGTANEHIYIGKVSLLKDIKG